MTTFLQRLGMDLPIIQAPMAGVSTPALAAAVCEAGALGSIAVGATDAAGAAGMIAETRERTALPFNVNLFCHAPATPDPAREAAWIAALRPTFARFDAEPPPVLREIYTSFVADDAMLGVLLDARPAVISFHFGLPDTARIAALKATGTLLVATATSLAEAHACVAAGIDAIVAQGIEAGGHRGMFDPSAPDDQLGAMPLVRLLATQIDRPVIAAGGIMDGAGIAAALALGARAAQLGTAFIACPESAADAGHRAALMAGSSARTRLTDAISGRPARCLDNALTALGETLAAVDRPDYPVAYDAGKALAAAARTRGDSGYGAWWAGQGAPLARALPAAELVPALASEWRQVGSR
jgi:nitronate monooxygenase